MKILFLVFMIAVASGACHAQHFDAGSGATLGTEISIDDDLTGKPGFGINLRSLYKITPRWGVTGGFTYFFPDAPEGLEAKAYQFNFDGTYDFAANEHLDFYGLFGFDLVYAKAETETSSADDTEIGLELGIGIIIKWGIFFEAKAEGTFEQGQFTLGYLYKFSYTNGLIGGVVPTGCPITDLRRQVTRHARHTTKKSGFATLDFFPITHFMRYY